MPFTDSLKNSLDSHDSVGECCKNANLRYLGIADVDSWMGRWVWFPSSSPTGPSLNQPKMTCLTVNRLQCHFEVSITFVIVEALVS